MGLLLLIIGKVLMKGMVRGIVESWVELVEMKYVQMISLESVAVPDIRDCSSIA